MTSNLHNIQLSFYKKGNRELELKKRDMFVQEKEREREREREKIVKYGLYTIRQLEAQTALHTEWRG